MPSRAGGEEKSEPYRLFTAQILNIAADSIINLRQHPNVMIMGDFNDYPTNNSIAKVLGAVAPPTDWKYYDSVYTERFMRTPQENFEGYAATSPLRRVKNLQGKLLLVHGTAGDNVHFMQTMEYAEALVQAGKQFDMHVYKDRNHSIYGGNTRYHLYTKMANYLFNNL